MSGTLYILATPIGNLGDVSQRFLETLSKADLIAAEDTRVTLKLLNHFGIKKPLTSYHEHNKAEKGKYLTGLLKEGKDIALVSDAGTPAISDPGEDLVRLCIEEGIAVTSVPGPVAAINALILSGIDTKRFCFEGFLSVNKRSRKEHLNALKDEKRTMIFYEAPHKLKYTLSDMAEVFGEERRIALVRELTKIHEEVLRLTFSEAMAKYELEAPRGEYVIVVSGKEEKEDLPEDTVLSVGKVKEKVDELVKTGISKNDAIKETAAELKVPKREVYNLYHSEKSE